MADGMAAAGAGSHLGARGPVTWCAACVQLAACTGVLGSRTAGACCMGTSARDDLGQLSAQVSSISSNLINYYQSFVFFAVLLDQLLRVGHWAMSTRVSSEVRVSLAIVAEAYCGTLDWQAHAKHKQVCNLSCESSMVFHAQRTLCMDALMYGVWSIQYGTRCMMPGAWCMSQDAPL